MDIPLEILPSDDDFIRIFVPMVIDDDGVAEEDEDLDGPDELDDGLDEESEDDSEDLDDVDFDHDDDEDE